jgi:hypothetical protein
MMDDKNPHRVQTSYSERVYWKGNSACGGNDEPTRVDLLPANKTWPELTFELPRQRLELERVENMMGYAYEQGRRDKAFEVRMLFKNVIGL